MSLKFFNLQILESLSAQEVFKALRQLVNNQTLPKHRTDKIYFKNGEPRNSFIYHLDKLLKEKADPSYIIQYVRLAGRRNYGMYKLTNDSTLDLSLYPDINIAAIKYNPLIKIVDNKIHFKYEDKNGYFIQEH